MRCCPNPEGGRGGEHIFLYCVNGHLVKSYWQTIGGPSSQGWRWFQQTSTQTLLQSFVERGLTNKLMREVEIVVLLRPPSHVHEHPTGNGNNRCQHPYHYTEDGARGMACFVRAIWERWNTAQSLVICQVDVATMYSNGVYRLWDWPSQMIVVKAPAKSIGFIWWWSTHKIHIMMVQYITKYIEER